MKQSQYKAYASGYVLVPAFWAWVADKMDRYESEAEARKAYHRAIKAGATRARNKLAS